MLGNFKYCNPTKLYFGDESLNYLSDELKNYGKNIVLIYGGGSIKKNGIYDDVINILKENNKNIFKIIKILCIIIIGEEYVRKNNRNSRWKSMR